MKKKRGLLATLKKLLKAYLKVVIVLSIVYILLPPVSTLMMARWLTFQGVERDYVPLTKVSHSLLSALVVAEDDQFCHHWGIDVKSMGKAVKGASGGERPRGASTISMQVAKNLFLWPQRSYIRKVVEIPIALYLDLIWSKRRMMEVYLSVAEWGDGVFGIEAAAQKYFHKSAKSLGAYEAAMLVAALPNPQARNPANASFYQASYAATILNRMGGADLSCF